jgi:hypothetical protein
MRFMSFAAAAVTTVVAWNSAGDRERDRDD